MQNKIERFDRIVSSLQEKGSTVTNDHIAFRFNEHYRENGRLNKRQVSGKVSRITLDVDEKNGCVSVVLGMVDTWADFLLQKYKDKLTVTERFMADLEQDPETGLWNEEEVELDIEPENNVLDTLLDIAERLVSRKETVYKEQLIVETDKGCFFYLYNADGDIVEHSAKNAVDAVNKIDERLASEGLYDANGNLNKNL